MSSDRVQYLTNFGEAKTLIEQETTMAEKYLVHVPGRTAGTYKVSFWCIYCNLHATAKEPEESLEPMEHGWKEHFDLHY